MIDSDALNPAAICLDTDVWTLHVSIGPIPICVHSLAHLRTIFECFERVFVLFPTGFYLLSNRVLQYLS
jgi:hypothetical protein